MKKIFLLGLVGLLTSCISKSEAEKRKQTENETEGVFNDVVEIHYKGHSYLYFNNTYNKYRKSLVHNPDCTCHEKDSNSLGGTDFSFN